MFQTGETVIELARTFRGLLTLFKPQVYRNSTLIIHFLLIDVSNFKTDDGNIVEYDYNKRVKL